MDERERDAARKAAKRASARDIKRRPAADPERRAACLADIYQFLETYASAAFYQGFTAVRREIVAGILAAATTGGDQAIAAPRGEGKTTIVEWVTIYCLLKGLLRFPLICAATGPDAERILQNIKTEFECNEKLHADFPETDPIWDLEGAPQRAGSQTYEGKRTHMKWAGNLVVFPTADDWAISGAILMTRGLDAAIRGIRVGATRPDLVIIDDPETRESAEQPLQVEKRARTIEQDIGGLGGPQRKLSRLMLCTLMNRTCLSYQYTDPATKPSWKGKRYRLVAKYPDRMDLWEEYITRRQLGQQQGDSTGRLAHQFYLDHQEQMDAGAEVTNPHRFVSETLGVQLYQVSLFGHQTTFLAPGRSQTEASAIQHAFNIIADRGQEAFDTELQNDPPAIEGPQDSGITASLVQSRLSGYTRRIVPPETVALTGGIDVGKYALHWAVTAWQAGAKGHVIDYGVTEVAPQDINSDQAIERAILRALHTWREETLAEPYQDAAGKAVPVNLTLVDAAYKSDAIYLFCKQSGGQAFRPAHGIGESDDSGRRSAFRMPDKPSAQRRLGDHWFLSFQQRESSWLVVMDTDHWKTWVHERFLTPSSRPASLSLFGDESRFHLSYSKHITAEVQTEEFIQGKGLRRKWTKVNRNNHYLDATYMASVAGSMLGVRLLPAPEKKAAKRPTGTVVNAAMPDGRSFFIGARR